MAAKAMVGYLLKYFGSMVVKVKVFGSMGAIDQKEIECYNIK
jgi:hypothetical protein